MMRRALLLCIPFALAACGGPPSSAPAPDAAPEATPATDVPAADAPPAATPAPAERPMDEVPKQETAANGDRQFLFANGCVVVLEPKRAVVKSEGKECESHHRDIALLYASAD